MMLADVYKIPIGISLGVIATILTLSIVLSLLFPRKREGAESEAMTGNTRSKQSTSLHEGMRENTR
jgi:hypothetical protein